MKVFDIIVYEDMQRMAELSPIMKRVAESIDNGVLDRRIKTAVMNGVKSCSFMLRGKQKVYEEGQ